LIEHLDSGSLRLRTKAADKKVSNSSNVEFFEDHYRLENPVPSQTHSRKEMKTKTINTQVNVVVTIQVLLLPPF
jgi:hypothetical protein